MVVKSENALARFVFSRDLINRAYIPMETLLVGAENDVGLLHDYSTNRILGTVFVPLPRLAFVTLFRDGIRS